jgi:RHS repeat-associated protein
VRYVRDYLNGSTSNAGNHWVEIEVWGSRTTVYVGAHYERNGASGVATKYYYAGGARVAMRQGSTVYYLHGDHLGSTALASDTSGNKVSELRYQAFGVSRYMGLSGMATDRRFTGQQQETALGLYFYNSRYYDPVLGRFVQPDTIVPDPANPQSLNRYSYVLNNALRYVDPTGHADEVGETGTMWYQKIANRATPADWLTVDQQLYFQAHTRQATALDWVLTAGMLLAVGAAPEIIGAIPEAASAIWGLVSAACRDGDCTNEFLGAKEAVQRGIQTLQKFINNPNIPNRFKLGYQAQLERA